MNNRFKNKMKKMQYGHEDKAKLRWLIVFRIYQVWYNILSAIINAWIATRDYTKYKFHSSILWFMDRFHKPNYPLDEGTRYAKSYKAKMKLEYHKYYKRGRIAGYNSIFDTVWDTVVPHCITMEMIPLMMEMNLKLIGNSAVSSMCGVQPMGSPEGIGLIYMLRYTKERPPEVDNTGVKRIEDGIPLKGPGHILSLEVLSSLVHAKDVELDNCAWQMEAIQTMDSKLNTAFLEEVALDTTMAEVDKHHVKRFCDMVVGACEHTVIECSDKQAESMPFVDDAFMAVMCGFNVEANNIARLTRRGAGNTLWVSPKTLNLLETYAGKVFAPYIKGLLPQDNDVVKFVGTINGFIKVYCTELPEGVDAIMGYKGGSGESDAAIFYAPLAPIVPTGITMNPVTTGPQIRFVSKYDMRTNQVQDPLTGTSLMGRWQDYYRVISIKFDPENYSTKPIELR